MILYARSGHADKHVQIVVGGHLSFCSLSVKRGVCDIGGFPCLIPNSGMKTYFK